MNDDRKISLTNEKKSKVRLVDKNMEEHIWKDVQKVELDMFYYNIILSSGVKVRWSHPQVFLIEEFPDGYPTNAE